MTVVELARILANHIASGRGEFQVSVFQWDHGSQDVTDTAVREGSELVELYSGTSKPAGGESEPGDSEYDLDDLI